MIEILNIVVTVLSWLCVFVPIILLFVFKSAWMFYVQRKFVSEIEWMFLRITVPQEVVKTPLAMEQVFAGFHGELFKGGWWTRYIQGRVQEWYTVEIVSVGGKIGFYMRIPTLFRNIVESSIYAQYPDAEIAETEDYTLNVPN